MTKEPQIEDVAKACNRYVLSDNDNLFEKKLRKSAVFAKIYLLVYKRLRDGVTNIKAPIIRSKIKLEKGYFYDLMRFMVGCGYLNARRLEGKTEDKRGVVYFPVHGDNGEPKLLNPKLYNIAITTLSKK